MAESADWMAVSLLRSISCRLQHRPVAGVEGFEGVLIGMDSAEEEVAIGKDEGEAVVEEEWEGGLTDRRGAAAAGGAGKGEGAWRWASRSCYPI